MATTSSYVQAHASNLLHGLGNMSPSTATPIHNCSDKVILGNRGQVLDSIGQVLIESELVYIHDGNIVYEQRSQLDGNRLLPLLIGERVLPSAPSQLATLVYGVMAGKETEVTYQIPAKIIGEVFSNTTTRDRLPRIRLYSRRPVFDVNFSLLNAGYTADSGTLIHSNPIAPILWAPSQAERAIDRLPPALRGLYQDFAFKSDADLINALAMLLTGLLMNHFVDAGKPAFVLNGNQRGIGKSLTGVVTGIVLDGEEPPLTHYTDDEDELGKRLGAKIKPGKPHSVLFFDNRKGNIGGSLLESMALAPRVSVRMLGHNEDISRINDFIWLFTANNAKATADMTVRSVVVEFFFEGDPRGRFAGTEKEEEFLKNYARQHRQQILGELMGMVIRWREAECPLGTRLHRCKRWSQVIGGIMQVAGLPEFLANQDEATMEIDEDLQELITLAEYVIGSNRPGYVSHNGASECIGKTASEWLQMFNGARVLQSNLQGATNDRLRAGAVGQFFSARLNRTVPIQVGSQSGTAVLRGHSARSRTRRYWLEVSLADPGPVAAGPGTSTTTLLTSSPPESTAAPATALLPGPSLSPASPPQGGNDLEW